MNIKSKLLGGSILAGVMMISGVAVAQDAPAQPADPEATEVEEIVVTGSRIPRPEYEGVIPGVQVGEETIEQRLFTNAGDILNDIPLVGAGASLNGTNGGQTASLGVTYVDLLNLGTARTLTLVNGRRFVSNNSATIFVSGNETGSQVDASTIPVALIDRVDILTVGGAATYGADAVSGVVNYILKDDYEGAEVTVTGGQTFEHSDAGRVAVNATWGRNFLDDRLNVAVSGEYTEIDSVLASERDFRNDNQGAISNFRNGSVRNPAWTFGQAAFLPTGSDGQPATVYADSLRQVNQWFGGVVFNPVTGSGTVESALVSTGATWAPGSTNMPGFARVGPAGGTFVSSTLQQIPGTPFGACIPDPVNVCAFAPASLTAAQQAAVVARYGGTAAQALSTIQANRPTAREYFAANPNTPLNAFLGTFLPALPDVATTGALAGVLPRTAVPLRFNSAGNLETFVYGATGPDTPGTFSTSVGGDGANRTDATVLRVEQERRVGNVIANYRITDNLTFFTENLYSDIVVRNPISTGGLFNGVSSSSTENAALLVNVNHPFLDAADRAALAAAGITGNFTLSRYNEDLVNDRSQESTNETIRSVNGVRGDFSLFDRDFGFEISHTYGKAETNVEFSAINDVAFIMALDAVNVGGQVQCRARGMTPTQYLASFGVAPGGALPGVQPNIITRVGSDGVREQLVYSSQPTQEMIDACQPVDVFGEGRASQAARDFVSVRNFFNNESTQNFTQGILTGEVFDLPAGPLQFALSGEYRKEELSYTVDEITREGRTRSAPSATTRAEVEALEYGIELRVPVFGPGFDLPFVQSLEINPAIRWTQLDGSGERFRDTSGTLREPSYSGEREEIYTIAGTWEINDDILIRGNISKSVRNPSIVELFLGGQPFFTSATDPCRSAGLTQGPNPAARQANCIAEVRRVAAANGGQLTTSTGTTATITSDADALSFLQNSYTPSGAAFTGLISGTTSLVPEEGDSFTYGVVLTPSFIPNLTFAADYLEITVTGALGPLLATPAAEYCYDSPTYPDPSPQIGTNSCAGIRRDGAFNFTNGFELPFFNLGGTRVKAINSNFAYSLDLNDVLQTSFDAGTLALSGNVYYLMEYTTSGDDDFTFPTAGEGTLANPTLTTQLNILYDRGPFSARWTTRLQDATKILSAGTPITIENQPIVRYDGYATHTLSLGYDITEQATARVVIDNLTDEDALGRNGYYNGAFIDNIGRRWTASLNYRF